MPSLLFSGVPGLNKKDLRELLPSLAVRPHTAQRRGLAGRNQTGRRHAVRVLLACSYLATKSCCRRACPRQHSVKVESLAPADASMSHLPSCSTGVPGSLSGLFKLRTRRHSITLMWPEPANQVPRQASLCCRRRRRCSLLRLSGVVPRRAEVPEARGNVHGAHSQFFQRCQCGASSRGMHSCEQS